MGTIFTLPDTTFTSTNGKSYSLVCGKYFVEDEYDENIAPPIFGLPDFAACIEACAADSLCLAANWVNYGPDHQAQNECVTVHNINDGYYSAFAVAVLNT